LISVNIWFALKSALLLLLPILNALTLLTVLVKVVAIVFLPVKDMAPMMLSVTAFLSRIPSHNLFSKICRLSRLHSFRLVLVLLSLISIRLDGLS